MRYPDPDIIALDSRFDRLKIGNTVIRRIATGMLWTEGPAWNGAGRYLIWSDIPNDTQKRWLLEDGHVSDFRTPSQNSNGNTFDYQGRQLSCEHATRRVVRYEHDGSVTVLANSYQSKPLNAPNDIVVHPNGDIFFTDPGYGTMGDYEGNKGTLEIKEAVYRIDGKNGTLHLLLDDLHKPNGLCFSADYRKIYVVDTGDGQNIRVYDLSDNALHAANGKEFAVIGGNVNGQILHGNSDGIRCDTEGNIWASASGGTGLDGVQIFAPDGTRIGQIRLPEACSNVCFGGVKRNRLFMTASQSVYSVFVEARGAHIS